MLSIEDENNQKKKVALIGCGLIGQSWAISFLSAGFDVSLFDPVKGVTKKAKEKVAAQKEYDATIARIAAEQPEITTEMEELEDKDAEGNRQKFFQEVEALGEEQILELDKKLSRFDEIEK